MMQESQSSSSDRKEVQLTYVGKYACHKEYYLLKACVATAAHEGK